MKIFYQGNEVHSMIAKGNAPESVAVQGRILRRAETSIDTILPHYMIPRGEYECEPVPNPFLKKDAIFIALCGTPEGLTIGATIGSLVQWSGDGWDEFEIKLFDNDGSQIPDHTGDVPFYTMEEQGKRIADGTINSNSVIARHQARLAGAPQATEIQDD